MTIYRHVMGGATPGERWECTFHTQSTLTPAASQTAWLAAVSTFWNGLDAPLDNFDQLAPTDVTLDTVSTSQLDPVTFRQVAKLAGNPDFAGTGTTQMLPPQCSAGVTWLTASDTKSGRGRNYLPPMDAATLAAGRISGAAVTILSAAVTGMMHSLTFADSTPIVFSTKSHTVTPITGIRVGDVFDTQRRRRDKLVPAYTIVEL